ncbi:MAG: NUDIX domain-containing protein [Chitinophagaceae bacterium]|nr:MAG: NUDIX domain-containing protein [Chitinophagaceae bacterium]
MKRSAGILLYKINASNETAFFLVHPGGPFFAKKDNGFWTIPKGEIEGNDDPLKTAVREFEEETGLRPTGKFIDLGEIRQKGGKIVEAWAVEGDLDISMIRSNTFEIEWPPKSGKRKSFPEIDKGGWFSLKEAREKINEAQADFLTRLTEMDDHSKTY